MYKKYYKLFLDQNQNKQHYASHSHHYWPDVTRAAMLEYWDDSARLVDEKWDLIFGKKIPETQKLISNVLNISYPEQISFAPNTHEFVYRLLSSFDLNKKVKIVTTDSEFYSFDRQINRLAENPNIEVTKVATLPFDNFEARFCAEVKKQNPDLVFFSHVFFNSGLLIKDLDLLVETISGHCNQIVVDGYHGFMAVPTNLKKIENRAFYMAGSYKYAQGGEGCCFLVVPKACQLRPQYTGWFASFEDLASNTGVVKYSDNGYRFSGATMDFSALYRLHAVLSLFEKEKITTKQTHLFIQKLQKNFRDHLLTIDHHYLLEKNILAENYNHHGHFLTFAMPSPEHTKKLHDELKLKNIYTDYRGARLRFGFGLYQNECIDLTSMKNP